MAIPKNFADEWVAAWNARDLDAVLSHYAEDFRMASPLIRTYAGEASGVLQGKPQVRAYWEAALARIPELQFEVLRTYAGSDSLAIHYSGPGGRQAVEVFEFGDDGLVQRAAAHYAET